MKIQFSTEVAAFQLDGQENYWARATEVSRILQRIKMEVESGYDHGSIMDINGNKIGSWEL